MKTRTWLGISGVAVTASALGIAQLRAAPSEAPTARYQMDVATTSGMGAGGGRPSIGAILGGGGGGGALHHELTLRLGSVLAPTGGAPHADHFMPPAAGLGASVPLVTPVEVRTSAEPGTDAPPEGFRRPEGRLLLFWGCGAHVGPGQPVIIDFAKLAAGQMPPNLFSVTVPRDPGPTRTTSRTYGDWPNGSSRKALGPAASLLGPHRIAGNYSPEIAFDLDQDFMPPLQARHQGMGDGSQLLSWAPVTAATGYYAWAIGVNAAASGGGAHPDMVWWTSASRQEFGGGLSDWLSPVTVNRLIAQHVVLPPSQTNCVIPAEVKAATGSFMMTQLFAYGPEREFAYPPRPANPRQVWKPDWTARVRYRASTNVLMGMPGMGGDDRGSGQDEPGDKPRKKCKPSVLGVLRGSVC